MNETLILQVIQDSQLALACVNEQNNIVWASPYFYKLFDADDNIEIPDAMRKGIESPKLDAGIETTLASLTSQSDAPIQTNKTIGGENYQVWLWPCANKAKLICCMAAGAQLQPSPRHDIDSLTHLGNRYLFEATLERYFQRGRDHIITIILIDLDRFKKVNDTHGHLAGDKLLKLVSKRFSQIARPTDPVMRIGGDEFAIIIEGELHRDALEALSHRFIQAASKTFLVNSESFNIGASVGIATGDSGTLTWEQLYGRADLALYQSKRDGGGVVTVFSEALEQNFKQNKEIEPSLKFAIRNNELCARYRPHVDVRSGKIRIFELFIEWHHPQLGVIKQDQLMPIASRVGEINAMTRWMLTQALTESQAWPEKFMLAINIPTEAFLNRDTMALFLSLIKKFELSPQHYELTISYETFCAAKATGIILWLSEHNISITVFDKDANYDVLRFLKERYISRLKIGLEPGRSILHGGAGNSVERLLELFNSMGLPVVIQGDATAFEQSNIQRRLSDKIQGYCAGEFLSPMQAERRLTLDSKDKAICR